MLFSHGHEHKWNIPAHFPSLVNSQTIICRCTSACWLNWHFPFFIKDNFPGKLTTVYTCSCSFIQTAVQLCLPSQHPTHLRIRIQTHRSCVCTGLWLLRRCPPPSEGVHQNRAQHEEKERNSLGAGPYSIQEGHHDWQAGWSSHKGTSGSSVQSSPLWSPTGG